VRQAERDGGRRPRLTTDERARSFREGGARPPSQVMVLRYIPPVEFETAYHDRQAPVGMAVLT
jgi:hypothetical protein